MEHIDPLGAIKKLKIESNDNDTTDDNGLLICGNCNTPRQKVITVANITKKVNILCKCNNAKYQNERKQFKIDQQKHNSKIMREVGMTKKKFHVMRFENDDNRNPKISKAMKRYAEEFQDMRKRNLGLLIHGTVGNGKTFFAASIANYLIDKGTRALITDLSSLIAKITDFHSDDRDVFIKSIQSYPLLVIDDFGVERESEYIQEQVYNIIQKRYNSGLPLIITTNLTMKQITEPKDVRFHRIYDRILEMCHPVKVEGESRRREKASNSFESNNNLLGL